MIHVSRFRTRFVDVLARKPSGPLGRFIYARLSGGHGSGTVFDHLDPHSDDFFLEIGQGGGLLLKQVLEHVNGAAAIDHSEDMVALTRRQNRDTVADGRLQALVGDAAAMPWRDDTFTCGTCVAAFLFFDRPIQALREIHRVLRPGGRFTIVTPARGQGGLLSKLCRLWQGAARLYTVSEMEKMLNDVGFQTVSVEPSSGRLICYMEVAGGDV